MREKEDIIVSKVNSSNSSDLQNFSFISLEKMFQEAVICAGLKRELWESPKSGALFTPSQIGS